MYITTIPPASQLGDNLNRMAFVDNGAKKVQLVVPGENRFYYKPDVGTPGADLINTAPGYWWSRAGPNIGLWSNWY